MISWQFQVYDAKLVHCMNYAWKGSSIMYQKKLRKLLLNQILSIFIALKFSNKIISKSSEPELNTKLF
jgi:hypothetical protein